MSSVVVANMGQTEGVPGWAHDWWGRPVVGVSEGSALAPVWGGEGPAASTQAPRYHCPSANILSKAKGVRQGFAASFGSHVCHTSP